MKTVKTNAITLFSLNAIAALVLVSAGCGTTRLSSSNYARQIQREGAKLAQVHTSLSQRSASAVRQAQAIASAEKSLGRVAADLSKLRPPQLVESEHVGLLEGTRTLASELKPLRQLAKKRDPALANRTAAVLRKSRGLSEIKQAANRLEQHGYDVGRLPQ